ncbi:MAG: caspase family protein [Pseudanabaenaceae cyanobacterium bins.39]|nr:caspase family protein [Pseudanabaenaceae cyanobacterium bins.39]
MSRSALVVGINNYNYNGLRNLSAPANDAEAIAQRLEKYGNFKVKRFPEAIDGETLKPFVSTTKEFTLVALEKALEELFDPDSKQYPDTALFYFSGHGLIKRRGEGFLATSDTNPDMGLNGLSLAWLRKLLQDSPIKQQILWLDCCHSGAILNMSEADAGALGNARDRCFIAASRDFEVAYQAIGSPYSVLTKAILDAMDSERTSSKGLDSYDLSNFIKTELSGELQRPIFSYFGEPISIIQSSERIRSATKEVISDDQCPYKGLAYFDDNDTDPQLFFGRGKLTDLLIDRISHNNCLVLLGASGSGKSSVLRAGLLSQLRQGRQLSGSDRWEIKTIVPTEHPLKSLADSFVDVSVNSSLTTIERAEQSDRIKNFLSKPEGLRRLVESSKSPCLVLVIDQFEECFTLCQDMEERQQFFNLLINAIAVHSDKFRLVIAMRADFFSKCVEYDYGGLAKQLEAHLVAITPMNNNELREAIAKPAEKVGCEVEPVLVDEIVRDVAGSPANLPLMQFALAELWNYREGNQLTLNAYKEKFGGISGALEKRANAVYDGFSDAEKKAVKHIFVSLTRLGERNEEDTRRRVMLTSLVVKPMFPIEVINDVVRKLADEKLVVTTKSVLPDNDQTYADSVSENETVTTAIVLSRKDKAERDVAIVEVAHEALIRSWSKMREWLEENREANRQAQKLEERAEEWEQSRRSKGFLLQGLPLQNAVQVNQKSVLNSSTQEFIKRSQRKQITSRFLNVGLLVVPSFALLILLPIFVITQASAFITNKSCTPNPNAKLFLQILMATGFKKQLKGASVCNQYIDSLDLSNAELESANFDSAKLYRINFKDANLFKATLKDSQLMYSNLQYTVAIEANFNNADLEGSSFKGAYLDKATLENSDLKSTNFEGAYLYDANLYNARNLEPENIKKAYLCRTKLPSNISVKVVNPNKDCTNSKKSN